MFRQMSILVRKCPISYRYFKPCILLLQLVDVHLAITISLITSSRNLQEQNFLYHHEARQMPETIKKEALQ